MSNDTTKPAGRYLLFGGECYYAKGGFRDVIDSFASAAEAEAEAASLLNSDHIEWWQVFDRDTATVIAASEQQAYGNWSHDTPSLPWKINA